MSKIYQTDGKIISDGFPQIQIGDKLYRVDTRKTNFDLMQKAVNEKDDESVSDEEIIMTYALGKEAYEEIKTMELTVAGMLNLVIYIQAAIFDISFEDAEKRFRKQLQNI